MRGQLVLRCLHLRFLHPPLARLSLLGISWRLWGLLRLVGAVCLFGRRFHGTVLNVRVFLLFVDISSLASVNFLL